MVSRVQNIRSTSKNTRPPNTTRQPGEFFVNFADKQFGVIDTAQVPQDLIAIRFHSPDTDYVTGDHVIYQGRAYRAKQAVPAAPFNAASWETAGMADAPMDGKFYGRVSGAWDIPEIADVFQLQASLDAKAPLVSPAFANVPTAPTAAAATNTAQIATTAFVKSQGYATIGGTDLAAKVNKAGDTMTGPLTLASDPTVPLHAATKQYVDAKPSGANTNDNPPTAPVNGQLWWETDTGSLFIFYDDGNSQAWVQLNASVIDAYSRVESDQKFVDTLGDTMTGALTFSAASPTINLNKAVGGSVHNQIFGNTAGKNRWLIAPGNANVETGSGNVGSDFTIYRYADDGTFIAPALGINRATGNVNIPSGTQSTSTTTGALTVTGGVGVGGVLYTAGGINNGAADIVNNGAIFMGRITYPFNNVNGMTLHPGNGIYCENNVTALSLNKIGGNGPVATFYHATTACGSITVLNQSTTAFNTASSAELKEDLQSFDAGRIVDDTEVYDFKWKDIDARAYGVIAQQAVEVYPQAITYLEEQDWWGVDYSKYVPVILQELKALRARVAELEGDKAPVAPKKGH
jgi:hypothetical protein